jgi:hypothetical protein
MMGSSQIKIATGGGVSSLYDPIDVAEFTAEEIKACTDAAGDPPTRSFSKRAGLATLTLKQCLVW